uniref:Secreted protein n=1 Tax=Trichuris muris TaxID=70415 RepID=A0A5S6QPH4_TRIMR
MQLSLAVATAVLFCVVMFDTGAAIPTMASSRGSKMVVCRTQGKCAELRAEWQKSKSKQGLNAFYDCVKDCTDGTPAADERGEAGHQGEEEH